MKYPPMPALLLFGLIALWVPGSFALWVVFFWGIPALPPPPGLLGAFPWQGLMAVVLALLATGFLGFAGWCVLGRHLRRHQPAGGILPSLALAFLLGEALLGILGAWGGFFLYLPLLFPAVLGLLLAVFLMKCPSWRPSLRLPRGGGAAPETLPILLFVVLAFIAAMAPVVQSDGLRYHIPAPSEWLRAGRFVNLPYNANSNLPALQGLVAGSFGGRVLLGQVYQALGVVHFVAMVVLAGSLSASVYRSLSWGRERRAPARGSAVPGRGRGAFASGMILAAGIPVAGVLAAWPFSDVAAVAFFLGALRALVPGVVKRVDVRVGLASVLLGGALAVKLSLLPLCFLAGCGMIVVAVRHGARAGGRLPQRMAFLSLLPAVLVLGPWLLKSTLYHGNPVYPVAWGVFGGQEWSEENDALYRAQAARRGVPKELQYLARSPWLLTRYWASFEEFNAGPWFLAFLPVSAAGLLLPLAVGGRRLSRLHLLFLLLLVAGWVAWFYSYQSNRFLLPVILLAIVAGVGVVYRAGEGLSAGTGPWIRAGLGLMGIVGLLWAPVYHLRADHVYRAGLGIVGRDIHMVTPPVAFNAWPAVRWLNANTERDEPVLYIGEHRPAHALVYRPVSSDWFDTPMVLVEIRRTPDNGAMLERWRERGIRHVLWNQRELSAYEEQAFRPRFTGGEWARFEELRGLLSDTIVEEFDGGIYVCRLF